MLDCIAKNMNIYYFTITMTTTSSTTAPAALWNHKVQSWLTVIMTTEQRLVKNYKPPSESLNRWRSAWVGDVWKRPTSCQIFVPFISYGTFSSLGERPKFFPDQVRLRCTFGKCLSIVILCSVAYDKQLFPNIHMHVYRDLYGVCSVTCHKILFRKWPFCNKSRTRCGKAFNPQSSCLFGSAESHFR